MNILFKLLCLAALVATAAVLLHRCLLDTPLPDGLDDPEPLRQVVATYNFVFYTAAAVWKAGLTRHVFTPVKFLARIIRAGSANVQFPGLRSHTELIARADGSQLLMKVDMPEQARGSSEPTPCLLYLHGGGCTLNSPSEYHHVTGNLSSSLGIPVFSPDYRKSPEWTHPAALEDSLTTLRHLRANAGRYNLDPTRILLAGDSSGAHLSIAVTLRQLTSGEAVPAALLLIYPSTQKLSCCLPSHLQNRHDVFLSESTVTAFRLSYLVGDTADLAAWKANNHSSPAMRAKFAAKFRLPLLDHRGPAEMDGGGLDWAIERYRFSYEDWILSPLFAPEELLAKFPATLIQTCQFDVLRDEGQMFHERLTRLGVSASLGHYRSVHGMYSFVRVGHRPAVAAMEDAKAFLRSVLARLSR